MAYRKETSEANGYTSNEIGQFVVIGCYTCLLHLFYQQTFPVDSYHKAQAKDSICLKFIKYCAFPDKIFNTNVW